MKENPTVLRVGTWSQLEGDNAPWPGNCRLWEKRSRVFSAAQADGSMRPDLNPMLLPILVEGFMFSWGNIEITMCVSMKECPKVKIWTKKFWRR